MSEPEKDIAERRSVQRTKSLVKRTVLAVVEDQAYGAMYNHLYVEDVSKNGIRINLDREVEPESLLRLSLPLESLGFGLSGKLDGSCRVVWAKPLHGGTCVLGLEFQELDEEAAQRLKSLIEHWEEKQGLELHNLRRPVDAKIRYAEGAPWSRMVGIRAISEDGFKFPSKQSVQVDDVIEVRILLEAGTLETSAKIRWCTPMRNGAYDIGCEFLALTSSHRGFIELHLRRSS